MTHLRKLLFAGLFAGVLLTLAVTAANLYIIKKEGRRVTPRADQIEKNEYALVLGTAPTFHRRPNPFFVQRMDAAATLYRRGKVKKLLLSGDRSSDAYDEPAAMRAALISRGIPESATVLDNKGFRTINSVARAKRIFGLSKITIVTDDFHGARAVFLARHFGIDAVCFTSSPVPLSRSFKTRAREIASRTKAWLDVYVSRPKPESFGTDRPVS